MASLSLNVSNRQLLNTMRRLKIATTGPFVDELMKQNAQSTLETLKKATPVRFTGKTRAAWKLRKLGLGHYQCVNTSPVMTYLEKGTPAHGSPTGKLMFIPKTKAAHAAGVKAIHDRRFKRGVSYVMRKHVRGIKPHNIVHAHRGVAGVAAVMLLNRAIRKAMMNG